MQRSYLLQESVAEQMSSTISYWLHRRIARARRPQRIQPAVIIMFLVCQHGMTTSKYGNSEKNGGSFPAHVHYLACRCFSPHSGLSSLSQIKTTCFVLHSLTFVAERKHSGQRRTSLKRFGAIFLYICKVTSVKSPDFFNKMPISSTTRLQCFVDPTKNFDGKTTTKLVSYVNFKFTMYDAWSHHKE